MELHERVREIRISKGISQTFIANEIGITPSSYNMKELGNRKFSVNELVDLSKALNISIIHFFEN